MIEKQSSYLKRNPDNSSAYDEIIKKLEKDFKNKTDDLLGKITTLTDELSTLKNKPSSSIDWGKVYAIDPNTEISHIPNFNSGKLYVYGKVFNVSKTGKNINIETKTPPFVTSSGLTISSENASKLLLDDIKIDTINSGVVNGGGNPGKILIYNNLRISNTWFSAILVID